MTIALDWVEVKSGFIKYSFCILYCTVYSGWMVTGDLVKVRVGLGENECNTTSPTSMREKPQTRPIFEKSCC